MCVCLMIVYVEFLFFIKFLLKKILIMIVICVLIIEGGVDWFVIYMNILIGLIMMCVDYIGVVDLDGGDKLCM